MNYIQYFAYGSNMAEKVISSRRGIEYREKFAGIAHGWELTFNCPGLNKYEPAYANIAAKEDSYTCGVIYSLTESEFRKLVKTEGNMYEIIDISVSTQGKDYNCKSLISIKTIENKRPSYRYLKLLLQGAKENSLNAEYIEFLSKVEHEPTPPGYEFVCKLVAIYLRVRFFLQRNSKETQ